MPKKTAKPKKKTAKRPKTRDPVPIQGALLDAVKTAVENGYSVNRLAHAAQVPQSTLARAISGVHAEMSGTTIQALATFFGMELKKPTRNLVPRNLVPRNPKPRK